MGKKHKLVVIILVLTIICIGCTPERKTVVGEYFKAKDAFGQFVQNVYNARSENDIRSGIAAIREYLTDDAYETIKSDLGTYQNVDSTLSDLQVHYIQKDHSTNNLFDKIIITFRVVNGDRSLVHSLEFIQNNEGKYDRYNLYKGIAETQEGGI